MKNYPKSLLGLPENEILVLSFLKKEGSFKVVDISRSTKIPRTTVHFLLKKLKESGFVQQIKIVGHTEWKLVSQDKLHKNIKSLSTFFELKIKADTVEISNMKVSLIEGMQGIKFVYGEILKLKRGDRAYFIQGLKSAKLALKRIKPSFFFEFHRKIKERGIILDGITGEGILEQLDVLDKKHLKSHFGRLLVSYLIPDEYIGFETDIIILKNTIHILNIEKEKVIVIEDVSFANVIINLLNYIEEYSKKVDINKYIKKIIEIRK